MEWKSEDLREGGTDIMNSTMFQEDSESFKRKAVQKEFWFS